MPHILLADAVWHGFHQSESEYESRLLMPAYDGHLMQKLAIKLPRWGQISVLLFVLAMAAGPSLAQAPRGSHTPARPGQPAPTAPGPAEPTSIDAGKNGEQLFKANCTECHKTPAGLSRPGGILGVQSFLRSHYTASRESAAMIAAYLDAVAATSRPSERPTRRSARPDARPARKDDGKASDAKPVEAKPAQARSQDSPRPPVPVPELDSSPAEPASVPAPESKPAERASVPGLESNPAEQQAAEPPPPPPAAPAEQKPPDAPKAE